MRTISFGALAFIALLVAVVPAVEGADGDCRVTVGCDLDRAVSVVFESADGVVSTDVAGGQPVLFLKPGAYDVSVLSEDGETYYHTVREIRGNEYLRFLSVKFSVGNVGWTYGDDYRMEVRASGAGGSVETSPVSVDHSGITIVLLIGDAVETLVTPSDGKVSEGCCPVFKSTVMQSPTANYKVFMPSATDFTLSYPDGAEATLSMMGFDKAVPMEVMPYSVNHGEGAVTCVYKLAVGYTYGIRASMDGYADRCVIIKPSPGMKITMSQEEFELHLQDEVNRDVGISDMLLNINPEGYLRMHAGEVFEMNPERITLTEDDRSYYPFLKPEFHYSAINLDGTASDVVGFDGNTMTAMRDGMALVLVTYEAVNVEYRNVNGMADRLISASYPESTGLFVVTVGEGAGPDIGVRMPIEGAEHRTSGSHLDSDLDVFFYSETMDKAQVYLDPSYLGTTWQCNPVYSDSGIIGFESSETTGDQFCHVALVNGPNLIVSSKDGLKSYQVVKARPVTVDIINVTRAPFTGFAAGDEISVSVAGAGSPVTSQFYGADESLVMRFYGQEYVADENGLFEGIFVPSDAEGDRLEMELSVRCYGVCPMFGSHRQSSTSDNVYREASFGKIAVNRPALSGSFNIYLDTMVESGFDVEASVKTGSQGKTVDVGEIEAYVGKNTVLDISRGCTQRLCGIKSISEPELLRYDAERSGSNDITIVISPGSDDVGTHEFSVVINLMNARGTMTTTVVGKVKVLDPHVVVTIPCLSGDPVVLPNLPGGISVPEGMMFVGWNDSPDGSGPMHEIGELLRPDSPMVLYAVYKAPETASAFVSDGLRYTVKSVNGAVGKASLVGCLDSFEGDLVVPPKVTYDGVAYVVEDIGAKAFFGRTAISSVDASAVRSIGVKAFSYCSGMKSLVVSGKVGGYAFFNCTGLEKISVGDGSVLGVSSFSGCTGISRVEVGDGTTIGKNAFYNCVFVSADGEEMDHEAIPGHLFLGGSSRLTEYAPTIGEVFSSEGLTYKVKTVSSVEVVGRSGELGDVLCIPSSVEHLGFTYKVVSVGSKAFYSCAGLRTVSLGDVESIGTKAFARCTSLQSVGFENVRTIASYAFYGCSSLESADFGPVVSIGACAFAKCTGLGHVSFQDVSGIAKDAFSGLTFWDLGARLGVSADALKWSTFESVGNRLVRLP